MVKPKRRNRIAKHPRRHDTHKALELPAPSAKAEKYFHFFVIAVLLLFGIYLSVLYFGHKVVPNSDFPDFVAVGKSLLRFELPKSFKRAPVLGTLQVALGKITGGQHPNLTAGWLLNAILLPLNLVLLYLIAKKILPKAAAWFAVIATINPYTLLMLVEPIVETTFIFFILLTILLILKRSSWCYLLAALTCMVRYEGAALIFAAFVMDIIASRTWKNRGIAFLKASLAAIPLALWLLATLIRQKVGAGSGHYLAHYGQTTAFAEYTGYLWDVTFSSLLTTTSEESLKSIRDLSAFNQTLYTFSKIFVAIGFAAGCIYGIVKRKHEIWMLLLFFAPWFLIHTLKAHTRPRYCIPVAWLTLLLCFYGYKALWEILKKRRIPKQVATALQIVAIIIALVWVVALTPYLSKLKPFSAQSATVPLVAMTVIAAVAIAQIVVNKYRLVLPALTIAAAACLMITSNHFKLAHIVGNGDKDIEFKKLADWYVANAEETGKREKLVTTMPHIVRLYAPAYRGSFLHTQSIGGEDFVAFIQDCYKNNITYVAWDSRLGMTPDNSYYKKYKLDRIAALGLKEPKDVGPYKYVQTLPHNWRSFIYIYRLQKPTQPPDGLQR